MKKQDKNNNTAKTEITASEELDNMVLSGLEITQTFGMKYDETQEKPVDLTVKFDFDGVVLGRILREAAMKQLIITLRQRYRTHFGTLEDFMNRYKSEQSWKVADLLSPMARSRMSDLDIAIKASTKMDADARAALRAQLDELDAQEA